MPRTIKPGHKQLFCKPEDKETKTTSGLFLTTKALEKQKTAEVINVGKDVANFSPKDVIIYKEYTTTEIKLDGEEYFVVAEDDVLGTVIETQ